MRRVFELAIRARLLVLLLIGCTLQAQTTVAETAAVTVPGGGLATGTIKLQPTADFVSASGVLVERHRTITVQVTDGSFSVQLYPNDTADPANTRYNAEYSLRYATCQSCKSLTRSETWLVPTSASPVTIADVVFTGGGGTGNVTGPVTSNDNRVARFDGTTGEIIQNSNVTIDDAGSMTVGVAGQAGASGLTVEHGDTTEEPGHLKVKSFGGIEANLNACGTSDGHACLSPTTPIAVSRNFIITLLNTVGLDVGSTDDYAANLVPGITALENGGEYKFRANTVNTGPSTIDFNSLGPIAIKKIQGGITADTNDGDICAGQWVTGIYDGTNFQMTSPLCAPAAGTGTVTGVLGTANEITSDGDPATPTLSIASTFRITGKTATAPVKASTTPPITCTVGDLFFDTDITAGQNLFGCTSTDTFTSLGGGGGGLPSQGGQVGKSLITDGTQASWIRRVFDHYTVNGNDYAFDPSSFGGENLPLSGMVSFVPAVSAQAITGVGVAITCGRTQVQIDPDADYTLTAAPTIADGSNGDDCWIQNTDTTFTVTVQDQDTLLNSNLQLLSSTVAIGPKQTLHVRFLDGDFYQMGPVAGGNPAQIVIEDEVYYPVAGGNSAGVASVTGPNWINPTASNAGISAAGSAPYRIAYLVFSDTAINNSNLHWKVPHKWDGSAINLTLHFHLPAGGTNGQDLRLHIASAFVGPGESIVAPSFNTPQEATVDVPDATQNLDLTYSVDVTLTGATAGDLAICRVRRVGDHVDDTLTAEMRLIGATVKYRRTLQ